MKNNCSHKALIKVKNIVISGTGFWNPGDDFVRDGVIKILENLFRGYQLNLLFYNFNQDFFPQNKFSGITNMASKGDLNQYSEHIDAAVIAGLSAGLEINDLYNWIIDTNLLDRVYLIGAGYENDYVDKHISQEPAATIFKNARIITGRTRKKPKFISDYNLPYHHVNCPAILSVPNVKDVSQDKRIEKIAFSIQLPHQIGIMNQSCAESMHKLALNILFNLSPEYEIEVIAHHKSEYFYFVKLFNELGLSVPVLFSSFYQDMFSIYRKYDLIIATRLHSCLFGNGHGIPGIVVNDTDRHTHCLEGFPHSIWVNSKNRFDSAFREIRKWNYVQVAEEAEKFKERLLNHYLNVLADPFGLNIEEMNTLEEARYSENLQVPFTIEQKDQDNYGVGKPQSVSDENGGTSNDSFARDLTKRLIDTVSGDVDTKRRVLNIFNRLTKDHWLEKNIEAYRRLIQNRVLCFDAASFLNWYAKYFRPRYYLEVGVRRGRSLAQVLSQSPATTAFGFDMWIPDYGSKPLDSILAINPGPEFVLQELRNIGSDNLPILIKGNSHQTLPKFWSDNQNPQQIDLIFVDGDHTYAGAKLDLDICLRHLSGGGALVFDDISHPSHPELEQLWKETKIRYPDCIYIEHSSGMGTGVVFKPPFDNVKRFLSKDICFLSTQNAGKIENKGLVDKSANANLPVHFFTIVLNGEPFIRYHIDIFKRLSFKWHWHIIEGVAELKHDTAWSLQNGGCISDELHRCGLSNDGTTKYLDEIVREYPENISIYRKPEGMFWSGKLEMINAPLENINEECLLWQVDADELWTIEQICTGRVMFMAEPDRTAAYYLDHFFVGEDLTITTIDTYGNNTTYEWLRTWRFKPSFRWATHEPPRLCMPTQDGQWIDISTIKPFKHNETEANGMVFQHYAYATERQLRFKEIYYGYKNGIEGWRSLQKQSNFPVFLREYFPWVKDTAQVDTIASQNIEPLASRDNSDQWRFSFYGAVSEQQPTVSPGNCKEILFVRTDSIGDNILAMAMIPHIKDKYPKANITTLCQEHISELYEACPFVNDIVTFDKMRSYEDEEYRSSITQQLQAINADLTLNSVYSREPLTDVFAIGSGAKERIAFNGNLCNISSEIRDKHNQFYSRLLPSGEEHKQELERNRDFLKGLGIVAPPLQPIMWTTPEDEQFAQKLFDLNNINQENTIALFPSAQHYHKVYQHYQLVLQHFQDFDLVVLGGKDAMVQADKICEKFRGNCVNLTGKTTICQMASVIRRCRIYIGSDSAGAHVACAVGVPNVVLLGGGHFNRFLPYSPLTSVVCLPLECYRCNWQCPHQKAHCISDISPDVIIEAIRLTFKQTAETPRVVIQKNSLWNPQEGQPKWKELGQYLGLVNVEVVPVGAEPYSIDVSDLNMQGENLFAKGDLDGALSVFTKALDLVPENAVTHNNLGVLYYNRGDRKKALNHYRKAAERKPENITFQKNLADFYCVEQGRVEEAMQIYVKVLNANPEDKEALLALAHICVALEKFDDAKDFYNRILKIEPGNKDAGKFLAKLEKCQLSVAGGRTDQENNDVDSNGYLVSAIVSTYNAERFIRGCLVDLEAQSIADKLEIIVVDTGSEQNESAVVEEFQKSYSNIRYLRVENRETVYQAWNRGLRAAHGKYITSANTDDRHRQDALEKLVDILEKKPDVVLAYGNCFVTKVENEQFEKFTPAGRYDWPDFSRNSLLNACIIGPQPVWRRSLHDEFGYFDENYRCGADYEFWLRISERYNFIHIREYLGLYFANENTISMKGDLPTLEMMRIKETYRKRYGRIPFLKSGETNIYRILRDLNMAKTEVNVLVNYGISEKLIEEILKLPSIKLYKQGQNIPIHTWDAVLIPADEAGGYDFVELMVNLDFKYICISDTRHRLFNLKCADVQSQLSELGLKNMFKDCSVFEWKNRATIGRILFDQGKLQEATQYLNKLFNTDPTDVHMLNTMSLVAFQQKSLIIAEELALKALELDRRNVDTIINLTEICFGKGEYQKAEDLAKRAIEIDGRQQPVLERKLGIKLEKNTVAEEYRKSQHLSPKRILVINNLYPPQELGGYGRLMCDFANILEKRGHNIQVLTSDTPYLGKIEKDESNIDRQLLLYGGWQDGICKPIDDNDRVIQTIKTNLEKVRSIIRGFRPELCLLGNIDFLSHIVLTPLLEMSIPVIHHLGNKMPGYNVNDTPQSDLYRLATASKWLRDEVIRQGYPLRDISVIYPGALAEEFRMPVLPARDKLRIAYAGIVLPYKGPHIMIEALKMLHERGVDFCCALAGTTTDVGFVDRLKRYVVASGMQDKIDFLGFLPRAKLKDFFARHNVLVFPSIVQEAFGISQVEAMAAGLTVVSSGTGGAKEIIDHGKSGLIFESNNSESLAKELFGLVENPQKWQFIAEGGEKRAIEKFDIERSVDILEHEFLRLINRKNPAECEYQNAIIGDDMMG